MDADTASQILGKAENNCLISRSLRGLLLASGQDDLAGLAMAIHQNSRDAAELAGEIMGVEPNVD